MTQLQEERIQLGPRHLEEELQDHLWEVDALRHERDSLVAERGAVGSDTTMAVVGVTGPSSDRMAALIEEGEMKRRKMEAALHEEVWWWKLHPMWWMRPQLHCRHQILSTLWSWICDCLRLIRWTQMMISKMRSNEYQVVCQWKQRSRQSVLVHATVEGFAVLATDVDDDIDSGSGGEMVNTSQFDITAVNTDQEDVRSEGERPRRRWLVFPWSSGFECGSFVDDEDRDGASEAGLESVRQMSRFLKWQDHVPRSGVFWSPWTRWICIVFPMSEFDEEHSQIFGRTVQKYHEGCTRRSWWTCREPSVVGEGLEVVPRPSEDALRVKVGGEI